MNDERPVITVDGFAGTGKSSLSKMLAEKLGFAHLNTGALYRAVAFLALREGINPDIEDDVVDLLDRHQLELRLADDKGSDVVLDGVSINEHLYSVEASENSSKVAKHPKVREWLVPVQRTAFSGHGMVAEGRDMGTVLFPDAAIKFFVEVDLPSRVERRLMQRQGSLENIDPKELELLRKATSAEIEERDARDAGRDVSPTKPAEEAIFINNSHGSLTETLENMYCSVANRLGLDA